MAGSTIRVGQGVRPRVGEGQQVAVPLGHPPGRAGLVQLRADRLRAETRVEEGRQIVGRIGDAEPLHEGIEEGLPSQHAQGGGVGVYGGADHGVGHSARLGP